MSVLDTFYLIFKTDASGASNDVKALDRQIAELAAKQDKRNEAENKQLKELRKQRQEMTRDLNDQRKAVEETGGAYVKMIESAASAVGAAVSFGAIKTGVLNAADFNRQLSIMAGNTGRNAQELKAFSFAFKQLGGDAQDAIGLFSTLSGASQETGLPMPSLEKYIRRVREDVKKLSGSPQSQLAYLSQSGFTTPAQQRLALMSDEEYEKLRKQSNDRTELTKREAEVADEYAQSWSKVQDQMDGLFTIIGSDVLPVVKALNDSISGFLGHLKSNKAEMYGFFATMAAGATLAAGAVAKLVAARGLVGAAGAVIGGGALAVGAGAAAGSIYFHKEIADWIDGLLHGKEDAATRSRFKGGAPKGAMAFWMSQGYDRESAAVMAAQEHAESSGRPGARNVNNRGGLQYGLYQWSENRRRLIRDGLGIDVASASAEDQRKAAAWEMQNMGIADRLKSARGIDAKSFIATSEFENPGNNAFESARRAQMAMGIASSFPLNAAGSTTNSATANVKIDRIDVHTQATDAHGVAQGITKELGWQMNMALSLLDNSWAR